MGLLLGLVFFDSLGIGYDPGFTVTHGNTEPRSIYGSTDFAYDSHSSPPLTLYAPVVSDALPTTLMQWFDYGRTEGIIY